MQEAPDPELRDGILAFASKLHRIQDHLLQQSDADITYRNFRGLQRISNGFNTLTKLGTFATITYSALSQSMAALIAKGYVTRTPGADRREAVLAITPAGRASMNCAARLLDDFVGTLMEGIPESEVASFRKTLFRMLNNLDAVAVSQGLRPAERARRGNNEPALDPSID